MSSENHLLKLNVPKIETDYKLDLSKPFDKTILRYLIEIDTKLFSITNGISNIGQCFQNPRLDNKTYNLPKLDSFGIVDIEDRKGILRFRFSAQHIKAADPNMKKQ